MKLLILTQKVDQGDDVLGFFHRWIVEFSKHCEEIVVIALGVGEYDLPKNVRVVSLGKEKGSSMLARVWRFYSLIIRERKRYDSVFVHMNPEYVVLGGVLWRLIKKRVGLFYTHRQVNLKLRIAERLAHIVFSASRYSFRIPSKKLRVVGHGIDIAQFMCRKRTPSDRIHVLTVGRITKIKNCDTLVKAAHILKKGGGRPLSIVFVGAPVTADDGVYDVELKALVKRLSLEDMIHFTGSIPNRDLPAYYCNADVVVNMTPTGGIDKAVLEGMASGAIPLVSNRAFEEYFGKYASALIFEERNPEDLAEKIARAAERRDRGTLTTALQKTAEERFSVEGVISRILSGYR